MYLEHFGIEIPPFSIGPDPTFAFDSRAQRASLGALLTAIDGGAEFVKLTGAAGAGKTLTCHRLVAALRARGQAYDVAYVANPCLSPRALLLAVTLELRLRPRADATESHLLAALDRHLRAAARAGRRLVVCLDEAQAMPVHALQALHLVADRGSSGRRPLQVVLAGQPELDRKLARPELRGLARRVACTPPLAGLAVDETEPYLAHRLSVAGYRGEPLFAPYVARRVHAATRGLPRRVNIVAHKALVLAFRGDCLRVHPHHVRAAAAETPYASRLGNLSHLLADIAQWLRPRARLWTLPIGERNSQA
ncbi:MAG TPA: AAA family ATPase [Burkholderiaceae bacterium]|jgi:MSHA biogenesis protein MshM|nr:AAA family ATPase [Burkholderiaceae bacterium]